MRGVFVVRFLAFLAFLSIVGGVVFLEEEGVSATSEEENTPEGDSFTTQPESAESDDSQESDEAFFSTGGI